CRRADIHLPSFPTRRSSDLFTIRKTVLVGSTRQAASRLSAASCFWRHLWLAWQSLQAAPNSSGFGASLGCCCLGLGRSFQPCSRSEEHTSELQSRENLVCRL